MNPRAAAQAFMMARTSARVGGRVGLRPSHDGGVIRMCSMYCSSFSRVQA